MFISSGHGQIKFVTALFAFLLSTNVQAYFYCETKTETKNGNPTYSVDVYEMSDTKSSIKAELTTGDNQNMPVTFNCLISKSLNDVTDYICHGQLANISIHTATDQSGDMSAEVYSSHLGIEANDMVCIK